MKKKGKTIILITGNKIIDGIIVMLCSLVFLSIPITLTYYYGYFGNWYQIWGVLGHLLGAICLFVLIPMGLLYFTIGLYLVVHGVFERLLIPEKAIYLAIIFIPTIISLTLLTLYGILPPNLYAYLLEKVLDKVITFIIGATMGYLYAKQ